MFRVMVTVELWYVLAGALLVVMALSDSMLQRLPVTTAMLYVVVGVVLGPLVLGWFMLDPMNDARLIERCAEVVVIISLFAAGLKLRAPLNEKRWLVPVGLALVSMTLTVALITLVGTTLIGLPVGAAVLLGAVLAPTDPVLASDVQVDHPTDHDLVRFSLTGEAGLNDGTAFPFVMLGLGLLGLHELGTGGWRWLAIDVVWAVGAGIGTGALLGTLIGRLVLYLRREHQEAHGLDDFLALGLITLAYGLALALHAYGFLAVFAAGLAVRRIERRNTEETPTAEVVAAGAAVEATDEATHPDTAHAYMAQAVLGFSEQLERIGTVGVVLLAGSMLMPSTQALPVLWFAPLLLLVIRPLAVAPVVWLGGLSGMRSGLIAWFGIRGIGSIYYLTYALSHGVPEKEAGVLVAITLWVVATSVVVHGISMKPLMRVYTRRSA